MRRASAIAALALALAACRGKETDSGKAAAAAEVLPGSASDAMIAYDTLKSQPPIAVATVRASDDGGSDIGRAASRPIDDTSSAASETAVDAPGKPASLPSTMP